MKALKVELGAVRGERDAQAKEKGEAQKAVEDLSQQLSARGAELEKERKEGAAGAERVKALKGELGVVRGDRDAQAKEKGEAQKAVEDLSQQLSARVLSWRRSGRRVPLEPSGEGAEGGAGCCEGRA